jgi:hypothetical protein
MVCHQTICIKPAFEFVFPLVEIVQVVTVVIMINKYRFAVMTTMDHMVGVIRNYESTNTRHGDAISQYILISIK